MAYFCVHSFAVALNFDRSSLYSLAIELTKGSSGFASVKSELSESNTFETVKTGDHYDLRISIQIPPLEFIFGW